MAKLSEMPEDEAKQRLYDAFMGYHTALKAGDAEGKHPSQDYRRWVEAAATGGVAGTVPGEDDENMLKNPRGGDDDENVLKSQRGIGDDPPEFPGKPANPSRNAATVDGTLERGMDGQVRFTSRDGRTILVGDAAHAAQARLSNPRDVAALSDLVPGYSRLR